MKKIFFLFTFVIASSIFAQETASSLNDAEKSISTLFIINQIKKSSAPQIYSIDKKYILFTFEHKKEEILHNISVVFENENFAKLHRMQRNINGVYFFLYKLDSNIVYARKEIVYSYIVDGVWIKDPKNPYKKSKASGYEFSVFSNYKEKLLKPLNSPIIEKQKGSIYSVKFYYQTKPNEVIYIAGDFNNWDPYMYRMKEDIKRPGVYSIKLNFKQGNYYYYFIENGKTMTDSNNIIYSKEAYNASLLKVGRQKVITSKNIKKK